MRPGLTAGALGPSIVSLNTNKSSSSSSSSSGPNCFQALGSSPNKFYKKGLYGKIKIIPRSSRIYSLRFRSEKRRFRNSHEVSFYSFLFVVKKENFLLFFFVRGKKGFYNTTNKKHPFH